MSKFTNTTEAGQDETTACKKAGKRLYAELQNKITLTGVGVCLSADKTKPAIYLMVKTEKDAKQAPTTFEDYEVSVSITGNIVAY